MLKKLLLHIYYSCTNLQWYTVLQNISLKQHLAAFFLTLILGAVVFAIRLNVREVPRLENNLQTVVEATVTYFPDDLVLTWNNQILTVNRELLVIPIPNLFSQSDPYQDNTTLYLSSVPELPTETVTQLLQDHTYVVDSKTLYLENNGVTNPIVLTEVIPIESFTLSKISLTELIDTGLTAIESYKPVWYVLSPFFVLPILVIIRLFSLLVDGTLIYFLLRFSKNAFSYKTVLFIVMNAMIPSELIYQVTQLYGVRTDLPLYGIVFWLYTIIVIIYLSSTKKIAHSL